MNIGFDTIGNATLIAYDHGPVLITDPWLKGSAYFGSWGMSHEVPEKQWEAAKNVKYAWFSHGHPDHTNSESLGLFLGKKILLPDHYGSRMKADLSAQGFDVAILEDRKWTRLSEHIEVMCISDVNQDAVLLLNINGRLIINANDSNDNGWLRFVRNIAKNFEKSFLLHLVCYGDVDMFNFFEESGNRIIPPYHEKYPLGPILAAQLKTFGAKAFLPFSSMHQYQRTDSLWASRYTTEIEDLATGFPGKPEELLPAYISYDCETDRYERINPAKLAPQIYTPEHFGDNWSDLLNAEDEKKIRDYFLPIFHLSTFLDFISFRVGERETIVEFSKGKFQRGIQFEVPRNSLMTAIEYKVFDDLLIGNFMKTTLIGKWSENRLYPDFTPYVTKYADNGLARNKEELSLYFAHYKSRAGLDYVLARLTDQTKNQLRNIFPRDSVAFKASKKIYWKAREMLAT